MYDVVVVIKRLCEALQESLYRFQLVEDDGTEYKEIIPR